MEVARACELAIKYAKLLAKESDVSTLKGKVISTLSRCRKEFIRSNSESLAREDSKDFVADEAILDSNKGLLAECGGSLELLIFRTQLSRIDVGFTSDRCDLYCKDCDDYDILKESVGPGIAVPVPENFVTNQIVEKRRNLDHRLGNTYIKHAFKMQASGDAVLLRLSDIPQSEIQKLHFTSPHWTPKPDDTFESGFNPVGRFLIDVTNIANESSLNSDDAFELCEKRFKPLKHPSFGKIMVSWVRLADRKRRPLREFLMWKDDLNNAFGLFKIRPIDCLLFAVLVSATLVMLVSMGFFGWAGAPLVFGSFTRSVVKLIRDSPLIEGEVDMYADDIMGLSEMERAVLEQVEAERIVSNMLQPAVISVKKRVTPTIRGVILGKLVDLQSERTRPSDKGCRKLLMAFFLVSTQAGVRWPHKVCEILASLAQLYSEVLTGMHMFVTPLNKLLVGTSSADRKASSEARFCVEVWRAVAIILIDNPDSMAVPIRSIRDRADGGEVDYSELINYTVVTDAGPTHLGAAIYDRQDRCLAHTSYFMPFEAQWSGYQNVREFCGLILGLLLYLLYVNNEDKIVYFEWISDNISALKWVEKEKCNSLAGQRSFMAYTWLTVAKRTEVLKSSHREGRFMGDIDALSRRKPLKTLMPGTYVETEFNMLINQLFSYMNPVVDGDLVDHHLVFENIHNLIEKIVSDVRLKVTNKNI